METDNKQSILLLLKKYWYVIAIGFYVSMAFLPQSAYHSDAIYFENKAGDKIYLHKSYFLKKPKNGRIEVYEKSAKSANSLYLIFIKPYSLFFHFTVGYDEYEVGTITLRLPQNDENYGIKKPYELKFGDKKAKYNGEVYTKVAANFGDDAWVNSLVKATKRMLN